MWHRGKENPLRWPHTAELGNILCLECAALWKIGIDNLKLLDSFSVGELGKLGPEPFTILNTEVN